jgi:Holliday junction resolvasome RuvABC endonuclease subunit
MESFADASRAGEGLQIGTRGGTMTAKMKKVSGVTRRGSFLDPTARLQRNLTALQRGVLAIDPGSQQTGWAWWPQINSPVPAEAGTIHGGNGTVAERALIVRTALQNLYESRDPVLGSIAIEKPIPNHKHPAVALETTYAEIHTWARSLGKKRGRSPGLFSVSYNNQAVKALVSPRYGDFAKEGTAKERLRAGVCSLYGTDYRLYPEDTIDAIAIGILHLQVIRSELLVWLLNQDHDE